MSLAHPTPAPSAAVPPGDLSDLPDAELPTSSDVHLVDDLDAALARAEDSVRLSRGAVPQELLGKATIGQLIRYALVDWAAIALFWVGMTFSPAWLYPVWVLLIAGRFHSFGVILHDARHMPLRRKTVATRALEVLAGYPLATTLNAMRFHHIRHHRDSGMPSDPYFKPMVKGRPVIFLLIWLRHLLLVPLWTVRGPYGLLAVVFPGMRSSYARIFLQDRSGDDLRNHPEVLRTAKEELGQVLFHAALFTATALWPETLLFYYFVPATVTGLLAGYRVLVEHDYEPTTDRKITAIMKTTIDHDLGPVGRLFMAPRNIGYHIVHHIHPQVALEHLPALRDWYREHHSAIYPSPLGMRISGDRS